MKQSIKTWKVSHGKFLAQIQKSLADPRLVFDSKKHSICFGICFDLELRNAKANRKERIPSDFQHIFPMCSSWFLHKILIPLHVTMNLMKMKELSSDYFQNLLSSGTGAWRMSCTRVVSTRWKRQTSPTWTSNFDNSDSKCWAEYVNQKDINLD